jgi:adenine deaminase
MNCPNMNISVVGCDDDRMYDAVVELQRIGGGFVAVDGEGTVVARVALPVGGMMSAAPFAQTADALRTAHEATARLGCAIDSPFIVLSFIGLFTVPELSVTELGLVDTASQSFVDVLLPGHRDSCGHPDPPEDTTC